MTLTELNAGTKASNTGLAPQRGAPMIETDNLCVQFVMGSRRENIQSRVFNRILGKNGSGRFWALKGVTFTGYEREIIGVIGSNGAGKSSLCAIIAGLLKPDHGKIRVYGQVSALLSLGTGFNYQFSGRDNIYLNAMMLGYTKKQVDEIFNDIVEFSGIGRFIEEPLKTYSSGMISRLGFSIGANLKPEILILDEALSAGDFEFSEKAGKKLQTIIDHSKIVVVVTHNMAFVKKYCSRALWLDKGCIKAVGGPDKIVKAYIDHVQANRRRLDQKIKVEKFRSGLTQNPDVIVARNIGFKYRLQKQKIGVGLSCDFWPIKNTSFTIKQGEVVGIIGRNGEGKSTLCKILSGILKPDRGQVYMDGSITALLTFGTGFNIQLTGRDNILLNGLMLGIPKTKLKEVTDEIIEFSGIGDHIDKPLKLYSSGMRSRLGFSIAAMIEPDIFIIDEALNAGDMDFNEKASQKIHEMLNRAKAVLVVTHRLPFVTQVCTRCLWFEDGVIKHDGPPEETVAAYESSVRRKRQQKDNGEKKT